MSEPPLSFVGARPARRRPPCSSGVAPGLLGRPLPPAATISPGRDQNPRPRPKPHPTR